MLLEHVTHNTTILCDLIMIAASSADSGARAKRAASLKDTGVCEITPAKHPNFNIQKKHIYIYIYVQREREREREREGEGEKCRMSYVVCRMV